MGDDMGVVGGSVGRRHGSGIIVVESMRVVRRGCSIVGLSPDNFLQYRYTTVGKFKSP